MWRSADGSGTRPRRVTCSPSSCRRRPGASERWRLRPARAESARTSASGTRPHRSVVGGNRRTAGADAGGGDGFPRVCHHLSVFVIRALFSLGSVTYEVGVLSLHAGSYACVRADSLPAVRYVLRGAHRAHCREPELSAHGWSRGSRAHPLGEGVELLGHLGEEGGMTVCASP